MADWFLLYDTATGREVSVGTRVVSPLPDGLAAVNVGTSCPDFSAQRWDAATRTLVTRVLKDRLDDLREHPDFDDFRQAWLSLTAAQRTAIGQALIRLLGRHRYRQEDEAVELS